MAIFKSIGKIPGKSLLLMLLFLGGSSTCLFSQFSEFIVAKIITKNADTLPVFVEFAPSYHQFVTYRMHPDSKIRFMDVKNIKRIITTGAVFSQVKIKNKIYLFQVLVEGEVSLYYYYFKEKVPPMVFDKAVGEGARLSSKLRSERNTIIMLLFRTMDEDIIIKKDKDKALILPFLYYCPKLRLFVKENSLSLEGYILLAVEMNTKSCDLIISDSKKPLLQNVP